MRMSIKQGSDKATARIYLLGIRRLDDFVRPPVVGTRFIASWWSRLTGNQDAIHRVPTTGRHLFVNLHYLCWVGVLFLAILLASCAGNSQAQPDPRLKAFRILSERIIMLDNQAEVDGTIQNSGHDPFPYDVTIDATFYDGTGRVIGHAQGVAEDVFPGTIGSFVLVGQVDSVEYSRMQLTLVSLRERRVENFTPTPPVSP